MTGVCSRDSRALQSVEISARRRSAGYPCITHQSAS
jgi:hypothetical protein